MTIPFVCCAIVTAVSALISLGFSVAAVAGASPAERTASLYTVVRSLALALASVGTFVVASAGWLEATACAMIIVQAGDALVGLRARDVIKTVGPFVTAALNLAALWYAMSA